MKLNKIFLLPFTFSVSLHFHHGHNPCPILSKVNYAWTKNASLSQCVKKKKMKKGKGWYLIGNKCDVMVSDNCGEGKQTLTFKKE